MPGLATLANGTRRFSSAEALLNYRLDDGSYPLRPPFFRHLRVAVVADLDRPCLSPAARPLLAALAPVFAIVLALLL